MLKEVIERAKSMLSRFEKPCTYGSAMEAYIVSHNPIDGADVDRLTREFDQRAANRHEAGWPL